MMNSRLMSSIVPADCILFELLTVIGSHRTSSAEDFKSPRRRRARVPRRQGALQRRAARRAGLADKSVIGPAQKQGPRSMQRLVGPHPRPVSRAQWLFRVAASVAASVADDFRQLLAAGARRIGD
ncbi:unnamed protein product [Prorocentrum cordatum]|uniref:Uncharacterized protein n=1 Tax=Prorocentrum cordatum TaxID=2364126 RepID=A0ABN9S6X5_9DINO|nr:unnamed protein product [Polarella glacialis]